MRKHAYIIVANSISEVLMTSVKMIDDPMNDIYILFDQKANLLRKKNVLESIVHKSKLDICEQIVNWGGYSQINAVMTLLKRACSGHENYEYIHFFQGADLPIKTKDEIRAFFRNNSGKEFVLVEFERSTMAENKCHYYHFFCHNRFFRKNRLVKAANFGLVEIQKAFHIKKNMDISVFQGSALFSITQGFAEYLIETEQEIEKRFRYSLAADECFIQTMIMKSPFRDYLYLNRKGQTSNARLIDRTRPDGKNSPHIWRDSESDYIASQPSEICFARKFDAEIAPGIVEYIQKRYS